MVVGYSNSCSYVEVTMFEVEFASCSHNTPSEQQVSTASYLPVHVITSINK